MPSHVSPKLAVLLDRASMTPLHTQLYQQVRAAILVGRLAPGTRLPSTRDLAADLELSRNTVLNAFEQLMAESYVEGRVGDGTYVSRELPDVLLQVVRRARGRAGTKPALEAKEDGAKVVADGPAIDTLASHGLPLQPQRAARGEQGVWQHTNVARYDGKPRPFRTSTPALDGFPYAVWSRLWTRRWRQSARELLTYGEPIGHPALRTAIARYLNAARGMRCDAEQIILTTGAQHALAIVTRLLIEPGDAAWIEDPGYLGARAALSVAGARLTPVPVDTDGMDVDEGLARAPEARLAYVTPSHQYPLGATLSLRRRIALLHWADRADAWIIEDDYDSEFRYGGRPLPALQGIDTNDRVIYIGTFAKVLFPSLHIGYIVAPRALAPAIAAVRAIEGHASSTIEHAVLCDFISDGHFARHVRRMRALYATRQRALVSAARRELDGLLEIRPSDAGMHLMGWLPAGANDEEAARAAGTQGVDVTPLSAYCLRASPGPALRLGYTGYTPRQIWEGTRRLAAALAYLKRRRPAGR